MAQSLRLSTVLLIFTVASAGAQASRSVQTSPSFDCTHASTTREHAVCASPRLSAADARIHTAYTALLNRLSAPSAALVKSDQRQWLHWLDLVCPAQGRTAGATDNIDDCLQNEYATRLEQLQPPPPLPGAPVIYTRAEFDYTAASAQEKPEDGPSSPGFGSGAFAWPQIDNPTPPQQNWNKAIAQQAILAAQQQKSANPTFAAAVDPDGTISLTASVLAANDHVILADIVISTYGYGAAHPNTGDLYFTWLLDPGRELKAADLFRAGGSYIPALTPAVIEHLKLASEQRNGFPGDDAIRKAVATELANPRSWEPTRSGFTINFGQYEVGPYAIGMPSAELPWSTLKPYLNPTFNPAILPALALGKD